MAAIYPKSSDLILKILGAVVGLGAVAGVAAYAYYTYPTVIDTGYQPVQPVPYSHKLHAGQLGLDCFYCHNTVYKAAYAAVPPTQTCMNCHTKVKPTSPRLEVVRQSFATGQPIPWIQIHRLPDFVYFNHQAHIHGGRELRELPRAHRSGDRSSPGKAAQHGDSAWPAIKDPAPKIRPAELVTKLDWVPDRDPREIGNEIIAQKHLNPPTQLFGVPSMSLINIKNATGPKYWRSLDELARYAAVSRMGFQGISRSATEMLDGKSRRTCFKSDGRVVRIGRTGCLPASGRPHSAVFARCRGSDPGPGVLLQHGDVAGRAGDRAAG